MVASGIRSVTAVTTLSVIPYSCTWRLRRVGTSADPGQRVADQQVDDPGAAEGGLEQHDAGLVRRDAADDGGLLAERMRAQRRQRPVGLLPVHDRDELALA